MGGLVTHPTAGWGIPSTALGEPPALEDGEGNGAAPGDCLVSSETTQHRVGELDKATGGARGGGERGRPLQACAGESAALVLPEQGAT